MKPSTKRKRTAALLLALFALCLALPACQSGPEESSEPKLAADAQVEKAAASAAASAAIAEEHPEETLRVLTDLDCLNPAYGEKSSASRGKQAFQSILKYFGGTPSGIKAELEVLPMEGSAYDAELAHLRTEIMSGGGPDVFLMSGFRNSSGMLPENTLFQNPESAMAKGLFLPLDEYIENAQFMEFDQFHPDIMAAGRNSQGQVILPMFYRINELTFHQDLQPEEMPANWQEILALEDADMRMTGVTNITLNGFRATCLGQVADNANEELLLDQEEFYQRAKEAVDFYKSCLDDLKAWESGMTVEKAIALSNGPLSFCVPAAPQGHNASIESWCAVNINTQHPEDAFFIVDFLLSKEFLKQEAFWSKTPSYHNLHDQMTFFWLAGEYNQPVHTGLTRWKYDQGESVLELQALKAAEDDLNYIYFTSNIDRKIDQTISQLTQAVYNGQEVTDEDIRQATDKCYTTIKMMLAES